TGRPIDRRTVLAGTAGGLLGVALGGAASAAARVAPVHGLASSGFDPALGRRLQEVLDGALHERGNTITGAILRVERGGDGSWPGSSGLARLHPNVPMRPGDRFRAGSIMKPFVAATVLQLVERGRSTLDTTLPELLPTDVVGRFPTARKITV